MTAHDNGREPLVVYDGRVRLGHLVHRGDSYEAVDASGVSHGTFPDMQSAAFALPNAPSADSEVAS